MSTTIPVGTLEKYATFGDLLRFLRRRAGITQMELSIAVGYSDAQISRLEQNLRMPDLPTIEARFVPALGLENEPGIVARLLDLASTVRREDSPALGLCPYKGLSYFDETDADLFVGRETLTAKLVERVLSFVSGSEECDVRFLAIIGASGSGKSSLARAGLVPALRWNPVSGNWPVQIITPGAHPLESLAASLTHNAGSISATARLIDDLAGDPRSLSLYSKQAVLSMSEPRVSAARQLLLLVDQFEEVFTLCRSEEERSAFINNLLTAACEGDGPVITVITLRADFYAHCADFPLLRDALARRQEYIGTMGDEDLRRAIEEPALRAQWGFEPGLVDLLLHDVGHEPGALPLLSHALFETWQRRRGRTMTLSGYAASGGVRGAIAETAEAVYADQFTSSQQAIARRIFLRLTELGDETSTGDTRRRAAFSELIIREAEKEITETVLKKLADARLITTGADAVEVAHEALIREWPKLRRWLEDNREGLRLHRHLSEAAREWERLDRHPDGLYRGVRLVSAREWAASHLEEMNALEAAFLEESQAWGDRDAAEREIQRQRELEAAQRLADAEKQRASVESRRAEEQARANRQLRRRAWYFAGALLVALAMTVTALFFGSQARRAAVAAQTQQRIALARELAAAAVSSLADDPERSILLAQQAVTTTRAVDNTWTVEAEDALHRALQASRILLTLNGHAARVWAIAYSPDGTRLATASDDGTANLWDAATGQLLLTLPTGATRGYHGIAFSPDGTRLVTAGEVGTAAVWDARSGQVLLAFSGHSDWVASVAYSPDGKQIVTASEDRTATVWDAATGLELFTLAGHTAEVRDAAYSPDGKRIATAGMDDRVKIWDSSSGKELLALSGFNGPVNGVAFSPDGTRLATAGVDRSVKIRDAITGQELITLRGHTDQVWDVAFSPDGTSLASSSFDQKVFVWDVATGQQQLTLTGHSQRVTGLAFRPGCSRKPDTMAQACAARLATASWDGTAKVWNAAFSAELLTLSVPGGSAGAVSSDGKHAAIGYSDGSVKILDIRRAGKPIILPAHQDAVNSIAFSPDGTRLASGGSDQMVRVWDLATGMELLALPGHTAAVIAVRFSPDGAHLATSSLDFTVRVWDLTTGKTQLELYLPTWSSWIDFRPDGKQLAAASNDSSIRIWDIATGQEVLVLSGHASEVWSVDYSPDGTRLVTSSGDQTAKVWDSATGQAILTLRGHTGPVNASVFSPDGSQVATAGQDGTVKLWNALTGQVHLTLPGQADALAAVFFSADGSRLFTAGIDGVLRVYLLRMDDLLALARARVTRSFTAAECQQYLHLPAEQCAQEYAPGTVAAQEQAAPQEQAAAQEQAAPQERAGQAQAGETRGAIAQTGSANGKVCMVTDEGGVHDQFFNQLAYQGVQQAAQQYGWQIALRESQQPGDYWTNVKAFLDSGCTLIMMANGPVFIDVIKEAAWTHPGQKFQLMDVYYEKPTENVWTDIYAVDQAAFLAGYVAASVTKTGKVGTYGGINIPPVQDFLNGFAFGVAYYNKKNRASVQLLGWDTASQEGIFAGSFNNTEVGRQIGEQLQDQGADIILPVAGSVGLGTAAVLKERGEGYLIGVDSDWVITYPEYASVTLTSIEKRMDQSAISSVRSISEGKFTGGVYTGTLENGGVSIAPFHDLDALVTPKVKADLEQIRADIVAGKIMTGPLKTGR